MILTFIALGLSLQETPDIYEHLKRRNLFSPKLEKPKPPPVVPEVVRVPVDEEGWEIAAP